MNYGIWDTEDNCWIGDDSGPKAFDDFLLARIAAQVTEAQVFGTDLGGRYVAKELDSNNLRLKDAIPVKLTAEKALRRIEGEEPAQQEGKR